MTQINPGFFKHVKTGKRVRLDGEITMVQFVEFGPNGGQATKRMTLAEFVRTYEPDGK